MTANFSKDAESLVDQVEAEWGFEIEPFEPDVRTCFGQTIRVIGDDGGWVDELRFENIGYKTETLRWGQRFHSSSIVEWMFRACAVERMQTHADVKPIFELAPLLKRLPSDLSGEKVASAVVAWAFELMRSSEFSGRPHIALGAKALCSWAVELLLPGFSDDDLNFPKLSVGRRKGSAAVTLLDQESGPFSFAEMRAIEGALHRDPAWIRPRALFYLCRDWGLRPIQLALLREEDFGDDLLGPYINVPSVKGIRRSKARRAKGNFKKRYLSDEAASALRAQVDGNEARVDSLLRAIGAQERMSAEVLASLPRPMFPMGGFSKRIVRYLDDPKLRPYALHSSSGVITREAREISLLINIPRASVSKGSDRSFLNVSAYRFRHTKAMSMVMTGHSPLDVAEALDHESADSVKHYFDFSFDLLHFVNESHKASKEISEAVSAWRGRFASEVERADPREMRVAHLGICKASSPCPHHPTVTCYTCSKFRPYRDADHSEAERAIASLKNETELGSTGPVRIQIDAALNGVRAVIQAVKK